VIGRWAGFLLPGVAGVAQQTPVYARAWESDNQESLAGTGPLWVVLGDSLSQGIGATSYRNGWVGQSNVRLRNLDRHYRLLNLSKAGATTSDVLDRQVDVLDRLSRPPDLVTLLIGSNDMLRRSTRSVLLVNYQAILRRLPPSTVLAYLPQPVPLAHRVNDMIDESARANGFHTVSVRPAVRPFWGYRAADVFHPNDRGHGRLADVFVPAILKVPFPDSDAP
jgi:lysophospholipase L1-like esterase